MDAAHDTMGALRDDIHRLFQHVLSVTQQGAVFAPTASAVPSTHFALARTETAQMKTMLQKILTMDVNPDHVQRVLCTKLFAGEIHEQMGMQEMYLQVAPSMLHEESPRFLQSLLPLAVQKCWEYVASCPPT